MENPAQIHHRPVSLHFAGDGVRHADFGPACFHIKFHRQGLLAAADPDPFRHLAGLPRIPGKHQAESPGSIAAELQPAHLHAAIDTRIHAAVHTHTRIHSDPGRAARLPGGWILRRKGIGQDERYLLGAVVFIGQQLSGHLLIMPSFHRRADENGDIARRIRDLYV